MDFNNAARVTVGGRRLDFAAPTGYQLTALLTYVSRAAAYRDMLGPFFGLEILDVGANIGSLGVVMALAEPDAHIVCIEPSEHSFEYLEYNTSTFPNIECVKVAIAAEPGPLTIGMPPILKVPGNTGLITAHGYIDDEYKETVDAVPLDDWADEDISFIKMDIQGQELEALKGMHRMLSERRPAIFIELKDENLNRANTSSQDVIMMFAKYGYGFASEKSSWDKLFLPAQIGGTEIMEGSELDARLSRLNAELQQIRLRYQEIQKEGDTLKQAELVILGQIKERKVDAPDEPVLPDFKDDEEMEKELGNRGKGPDGYDPDELLEVRQGMVERDAKGAADYIDKVQKEE